MAAATDRPANGKTSRYGIIGKNVSDDERKA